MPSLNNLEAIDEEDQEYYSEIFIDELEHGSTGNLIDKAQKFIDDF